MSVKALAHDLSERPVMGAPRVLPVVLLCHATVEWCGRLWIANTDGEYNDAEGHRKVHQTFCEAAQFKTIPDASNLYTG